MSLPLSFESRQRNCLSFAKITLQKLTPNHMLMNSSIHAWFSQVLVRIYQTIMFSISPKRLHLFCSCCSNENLFTEPMDFCWNLQSISTCPFGILADKKIFQLCIRGESWTSGFRQFYMSSYFSKEKLLGNEISHLEISFHLSYYFLFPLYRASFPYVQLDTSRIIIRIIV